MIIREIEFVTSAATKKQFINDDLVQIVLAGRSNVGKSSFINAMLNNNKIARISQTPGKTRLVNYIRINRQFYFVDLPGYGYAKVNKETLQAFKERIEAYFLNALNLRLAILLLDARHVPTEDDLLMQDFFRKKGIPVLYVLTKVDKLSYSQALRQSKLINGILELRPGEKSITFSATTKVNRDEIWSLIESRLKITREEIPDVGKTV